MGCQCLDHLVSFSICITVTKIDQDFNDNEILGPNYTIARNDRRKGGGGVLVAIDNRAEYIKLGRVETGPGEFIKCNLQLFNRLSVSLGTCYRPPGDNLDNVTENFENIDGTTIILGDFNLPDICWDRSVNGKLRGSIKPSSTRKRFHRKALDIFHQNNFIQLVEGPTHDKGNTLDLVFIDRNGWEDIQTEVDVLPGISDHNMILAKLVFPTERSDKSEIPQVIRFNYENADYAAMDVHFKK